MAVPHADDAPCNPARCPCEYDKTRIKPTDCNEAGLAVILAVVYAGEVWSGKGFFCMEQV